jgi:hypothetical protein
MLALALLCAAPQAALACSVVETGHSTVAQRAQRQARWAVEHATAIVDGEVIQPFVRGRQNALVRADSVLRGPQQEIFEVGERDSCDVALENVGERLRLLLVGGPDLYFLPVDQSNARYEDRLLNSDRDAVWPYQPGQRIDQ